MALELFDFRLIPSYGHDPRGEYRKKERMNGRKFSQKENIISLCLHVLEEKQRPIAADRQGISHSIPRVDDMAQTIMTWQDCVISLSNQIDYREDIIHLRYGIKDGFHGFLLTLTLI